MKLSLVAATLVIAAGVQASIVPKEYKYVDAYCPDNTALIKVDGNCYSCVNVSDHIQIEKGHHKKKHTTKHHKKPEPEHKPEPPKPKKPEHKKAHKEPKNIRRPTRSQRSQRSLSTRKPRNPGLSLSPRRIIIKLSIHLFIYLSTAE